MAANVLPYDRPMRRRLAGLTWDHAALLLLALALLVVLATFRDYGVTWDEPGLRRYGQLLVA
jgi:hypothetical protein